MGNHGAMRTLRRQAAVGATSAALLLAAAGTSLATVRAARYDGGVTRSGLALPAVDGGVVHRERALPPTSDRPSTPDLAEPLPGAVDPSTGLTHSAPASAAPGTDPSTLSPSTGTTQVAVGPAASPAPRIDGGITVPTLGPASGPTPTLPVQPNVTLPCPTDSGSGALPHRRGRLEAVDLSLPLPGIGPLVLVPQAIATWPEGAAVRIRWSSLGGILDGGSSLTLPSPLATEYELIAGQEMDRGWIRFAPLSSTVDLQLRACRDRSIAVYSIGRTSTGSQLRIVGFLAPSHGTVTIDDGGGRAHFRPSSTGTHLVTLLTADDDGVADPLVRATVTVR